MQQVSYLYHNILNKAMAALACIILLYACKEHKQADSYPVSIISTDIQRLSQLLDLTVYKPVKVKYQYTLFNNAVRKRSSGIPGPSDYLLQAVLYFDSTSFTKLGTNSRLFPCIEKEYFKFEWLDKAILEELDDDWKKGFTGYPDFLYKNANGNACFLNNKVLLQCWTN